MTNLLSSGSWKCSVSVRMSRLFTFTLPSSYRKTGGCKIIIVRS